MCPARIYLESTVDTHALLCWPWGEYDGENDPPPPVVKPRGIPVDLGIIPMGEYCYVLDEEGAKRGEPRCTSAAEVKELKLKPFANSLNLDGYFINPDIKVATWLTTEEVWKVGRKIRKIREARKAKEEAWYELEGIHAMMKAFEEYHYVPGAKARFVLWFM
jgi:hypothetical protein